MKIFISLGSAESVLRESIQQSKSNKIGEWFPVRSVLPDGRKLECIAHLGKIPSATQQLKGIKSPVTIIMLTRGSMLAGMPKTVIAKVFQLSGKDQLTHKTSFEATEVELDLFKKFKLRIPSS